MELELIHSTVPDNPLDVEQQSEDMESLLQGIRSSQKAEQFTRLYDQGDTSGYSNVERADSTLCYLLAIATENDAAQIDALFRSSALMRPRWDEQLGEKTYRNLVLKNKVCKRT